MKSNADAAVLSPARTRTADFVALAKPRLNLLVVGSALAGYAMAGGDMQSGLPAAVHDPRDRHSSPAARPPTTRSSSAMPTR